MLKRKSVILLVSALVRARTSSGSYRNRYGANDWPRHMARTWIASQFSVEFSSF